jgi:hypothetical protein
MLDSRISEEWIERIWKEAVVAYFKGTIPTFAWKDEGKPCFDPKTVNMMQDANSLTATFISINDI